MYMYVRQSDYHYTDRDKLYYAPTQCNNTRAVPNALMQETNGINCKCSSCPCYFFLFFVLSIQFKFNILFRFSLWGERGGSVVECRTPEREVRGSRPTSAVLCPWARHFTPRKYWLITQEAMAPTRHDWKIVDWDVKPQHNQPNLFMIFLTVRVLFFFFFFFFLKRCFAFVIILNL